MLKVLINEEEVLTNKDFTIKKEMLNTPSVILNNVYPKTWEDTKDYTTNFYHPLDYSKCKIIDETYYPADPGITTIINGAATLPNVDITKKYELTEIEGNTTQNGTPTPSSPQPINVVSGRQEVDIVGKNLFDKDYTYWNKANTTLTTLETGIRATLTGGSTYRYGTIKIPNSDKLLGKTLTLNYVKSESGNNVGTIRVYAINNDGNVVGSAYNSSTPNTFNMPSAYPTGATAFGMLFYSNLNGSNVSVGDYVDYTNVQLEENSQPTTYEAYKSQSYEINLGKNLLGLQNGTYTNNGITAIVSNGEISLSGTAIANSFVTIPLNANLSLVSGQYTISTNNEIANSNVRFRIESQGTLDTPLNAINKTNTITYNNETLYGNQIVVRVQSGATLSDFKFKPMLEKGTQATSYSPYKTPIELCKINTYKDRIYKENGTWYLHKEIGKVVLNGSENWGLSNNVFYKSNSAGLIGGNIIITKSNYLQGAYNQSSTANVNKYNSNNSICGSSSGTNRFYIKATQFTTLEDFKTWLSTHNTIVYYILATPTTTEITDSELISQLNAIELLEGLNNISITSANLPGIMTIHYNYNDEYTTEDLLFCGVVKNSGNISLNPRQPHFQSLQILDFKTFLSEGELDSFVIYQKTILEAIQMVIANIQDYGFILGNINILNPTDIIGAYSTKDKTAYDVFNYIADITQSRWTTRLIDENHVAIDFYDPTLMIEGTPINYTQTFFEDNLIDDMTYSYGSNNYRNKQVMTSSQVYSNISQQQSIVANGYQTQFPTEQPIGKINSITSNGIPLTFATFNEKDMGYVADFYYSPGDNYFESEDLRTTGEILIIDYVAIVEGRQIITNPLEIDRINESTGRKGIISRYEQRNDATTSTELQKIGESYIKYKGTPEIKLKISTRSNIWEVGQRVQFNAPIEELDTEYMVRTKKINYISTIDTIFYEYELISSFNSETEINYFDNQRAKASGNIGEGEYISRNIDIESTANIIFYDTETTEVQVDGDNELNAILNSPFTS